MTNSNQTLADALGIEPQEIILKEDPKQELIVPETGNDEREDYSFVRKTFKNIIKQGEEAIEGVHSLAKSIDHPKAYEAMAALIKSVNESTRDLYDLQIKSKEINKTTTTGDVLIDKAVFVGNPADLLTKIKQKNG